MPGNPVAPAPADLQGYVASNPGRELPSPLGAAARHSRLLLDGGVGSRTSRTAPDCQPDAVAAVADRRLPGARRVRSGAGVDAEAGRVADRWRTRGRAEQLLRRRLAQPDLPACSLQAVVHPPARRPALQRPGVTRRA